ncbi:MAG: SDR family oxidoreductase [Pseudomonadota bacterium]|nr:SDR family oxidoreductase [Pseudomonadota bacterium]
MATVVIVGCGDIGQRVARLYQKRGVKLLGVVRSDNSARKLRNLGIESMSLDLDVNGPGDGLPTADSTIHYYAPPPREGRGDPRLERFLAGIDPAKRPKRIVYISTSAVYGHCDGDWVDEDRAPSPDTDRGRRRLAAEQILTEWCTRNDVEYVILRVPGIYGPGRLPVKRLKSGAPIVDENESSYTNRIHADDLAQICFAAADKAPSGRVYNVSDGHPTTMSDYFLRVADLLGLEPPPTISLDEAQEVLSPAMLSFLNESKRLENKRMVKELKVKLKYPTLRDGLPACLNDSE